MQQSSITQDSRVVDRAVVAVQLAGSAAPGQRASVPMQRVEEHTTVYSQFNVMPGRPVEETLFIREYRIGDRYIEASFDRHYKSSMLNSPDHLIFITALVHSQKLLYALLCREFGLDYDPHGAEKLKIWPTKVTVTMPKMVKKTTDVLQTLKIEQPRQVAAGKFHVKMVTEIEDIVGIEAEAVIYLL